MLSKSHRLTKKEFIDVYKKKVFFTPFFAIHALCPISANESKFSVVVSKKIAKKAVTRNALKRRYYLALETYINKIQFPVWCVILVNKKGMEIEGTELDQELDKVLKIVEKTCSKM
jgi:ribonuclease P protein component